MAIETWEARDDVHVSESAVPISFYAGLTWQSTQTYNYLTNSGTRSVYASKDSTDGVWPFVQSQLAHYRERGETPPWWLSRPDWGNPYYRSIYRLSNYNWKGIRIRADPTAGYTGNTGVSALYPNIIWCATSFPNSMTSSFLSQASAASAALGYGSKGLASSIPFQPQVELTATLAELAQEGVPSLRGVLPDSPDPREFAKAFLGWEFGVKPLANDVKRSLQVIANSRALLDEYARRFEKTYPVSWTAPETTSTVVGTTDVTLRVFPWNYTYDWSRRTLNTTFVMKSQARVSGEYLYHQYVDGSLLTKIEESADRANYLLGLDPSHLVNVWDALPWTWLLDWFVNIGDALRAATYIGRDGLVLRYGYTTVFQEITGTYQGARLNDKFSLRGSSVYWQVTRSSQTRIRATPFGFGLNPTAFSNKQWAILAALGLTKWGNRL